jgi:hypothetical protein
VFICLHVTATISCPPHSATLLFQGSAGGSTEVGAGSTVAAGFKVVLSDVLGGKDVVEGRDGRTDGRVG